MYPQFLITLDENDEEQDVTVRVGQAVNTVGLAGTRSGISGVSVFFFSSFFPFFFYLPSFTFPHLQGFWVSTHLYPTSLHLYYIPPSPDLCHTLFTYPMPYPIRLFPTNTQFQTHQTPVRIATGDRAELGTNEFFPYQPVLEGLVVLKKNEGFSKDDN